MDSRLRKILPNVSFRRTEWITHFAHRLTDTSSKGMPYWRTASPIMKGSP